LPPTLRVKPFFDLIAISIAVADPANAGLFIALFSDSEISVVILLDLIQSAILNLIENILIDKTNKAFIDRQQLFNPLEKLFSNNN
jgi:hypothetical protein